MASICRWVYPEGHKSAGTVAFKRGIGKKECMEIGGKDAQWFEEEWKPHWFQVPGTSEADHFPKNANKDATLELRDRNNYMNSIWAQQGEEALLRDRSNFGFSADSTGYTPGAGINGGDLQGRMTVPQQLEGHDFSPGTIWHQDMLNTAAANRAADLKKYPNYTGFQDNDPSMLDLLQKNRIGDYAPEIPINQPTDVNGNPISLDFQGGGDAQALADAERYDQIMSEIPAFGEGWQNNPALAEQAKFYQDSVAAGQPKTYSTSGYGGRTGDLYAEQPGERAAYMNKQARLAEEEQLLQARLAEEEQLLRDEKDFNSGLVNYIPPVHQDVTQANQNIFEGAVKQRALEAEKGPDFGLANYTPPVNEEQRKRDENLFEMARLQREYDADPDLLETQDEVTSTVGSELIAEESEEKETGVVVNKDLTQERWYEGFKDDKNPNSMRNKVYNSIKETGMDKILDGIDDESPQWLKDWGKGIYTDLQNGDYLKAAGKLWITRAGGKYALKTTWKLLKPGKKMLSGGNIVKVAVGAEVYEMAVDPEKGPIMQQIQDKVAAILKGPVGSSVATLVSSGDGSGSGTTNETNNNNNVDTSSSSGGNDAAALNSMSNSNLNVIDGTVGLDTTSSPTSVFNAGEQQQGYSGNMMDMFSNLFNPNPEQSDFWYKTREGDIPGNNRMREAMARLAYMGLYPEDRGTDPYQALSDDRINYSNNLMDAASSKATLNATAANRQYNQWKDMLPSQSELAKQLIEDKALFFGKSKETREAEAERAAGSLLRSFHKLMAKGVAPTPDNLKVANELEKAGIDVNQSNVQYAIENGILDELSKKGPTTDDSPSMLDSAKGYVSTVRNAFAAS